MRSKIYVGIDVSEDKLDIEVKESGTGDDLSPGKRAGRAWTTSNTEKGCEALVRPLKELGPDRIVLEAMGGHERRAFRMLRSAGLPAVIVEPVSVREFARAMGKRAKTDAIDARMIAYFAEVRQPEVVPLPTANQERIAELRRLRIDFQATRGQYTDRLKNCSAPARAYIEKMLADVETQIAVIDDKLHDARIPPRRPWSRPFRRKTRDGRDTGRRTARAS